MTARNRVADRPLWEYVTDIASESERDKSYEIKRRTSDGHLACGCTAYRFATRDAKTCKHIKAYLGVYGIVAAASEATTVPVVTVHDNETFTLTRRRAIAFGRL